MKRHEDAMDSFTVALDLAETDEEKYDSLSQVITVGSELECKIASFAQDF